MNILIIEDEESYREATSFMLARFGDSLNECPSMVPMCAGLGTKAQTIGG